MKIKIGTNGTTPSTDGKEVRQASWNDVDKFSGKPGSKGHLDLVELYWWQSARAKCTRTWRPANCWLFDEGGCKLYKAYKWEPVRLNLVVERTEVIENRLKPELLQEFILINTSNVEGEFMAKGSRSIKSTLTSSELSGHSIGASWSMATKVGCEVLGTGGSNSVCVGGSYTRNFGKSLSESKAESLSSIVAAKVNLKPNEKCKVKIFGKSGTMKVRVHYKSYLTGGIAADYPNKFDGHHHWHLPVERVLKCAGKKNEAKMTEVITLKYYTDITLILGN